MTQTLYERYKEALRAGHVALGRGRLDEAAARYREAIAISADRALPRAALGRVLLRLGDPTAALESFDSALTISRDDDTALLGRAQALVVLRRTAEAAAAYDRLADARAEGSRPADAVEAARRAVAIDPTDVRRARHRDLAGEPVVAEPDAGGPASAPDAPPGPDPDLLVAEAEDAAACGRMATAAAAALAAARAYAAHGQVTAAIDACLLGIGVRPADSDLHQLLARLAVQRGWDDVAAETPRNLLRLAALDADPAADTAPGVPPSG